MDAAPPLFWRNDPSGRSSWIYHVSKQFLQLGSPFFMTAIHRILGVQELVVQMASHRATSRLLAHALGPHLHGCMVRLTL